MWQSMPLLSLRLEESRTGANRTGTGQALIAHKLTEPLANFLQRGSRLVTFDKCLSQISFFLSRMHNGLWNY